MAHARKKRRTQGPDQPANAKAVGINKTAPGERIPKSMVLRTGREKVGPAVSQLIRDMRVVMQPHTAASLRVTKRNVLRDFTTMAGPLGVSHLILFSKGNKGNTNMRIAVTPRGPTFTFRVDKYSLAKDVASNQRHPKSVNSNVDHITPPLLVMNNFVTPTNDETTASKHQVPRHLETLATSVFQSLFPPISPQRTPLDTIRRVLLVNRETSSANDGSYVLSLRHYYISTKPIVSMSRGMKRLRQAEAHALARAQKKQAQDYKLNGNMTSDSEGPSGAEDNPRKAQKSKAAHGGLPDMGELSDIADYVLDPSGAGYASASDSEVDTDAEVEVAEAQARRIISRRDRQKEGMEGHRVTSRRTASRVQRRAVKLTEIGPRMTLRLVKVEEGVCTGKVMWHQFIEKSTSDVRKMDAAWERRRQAQELRKQMQRENLEKKRAERASKSKTNGSTAAKAEDEEMVDDDEWDELHDEMLNEDEAAGLAVDDLSDDEEDDEDDLDEEAELESEGEDE